MDRDVCFDRNQYSLYVTEAPFETQDFCPYVASSSYDECGVDEKVAYYIASTEPSWNFLHEYSFVLAETGDWYEDDYTRVEVTETSIIFKEKEES